MRFLILVLWIILAVQCRERYDIPYATPSTGYLVVDGFINYGDSTIISLSRTTRLSEREIVPETQAVVTVEEEDGAAFPLASNNQGSYMSAALPLDIGKRYRLNIVTAGGKQYQSDYSNIHVTPVIDSLPWKFGNEGVDIFLAAHDASNATQYYMWQFTETWEFHSTFPSNLKFAYTQGQGGGREYALEYRDPVLHTYDTTIKTCWRTLSSTSIMLGSTTQLSSDIIYAPILSIEKGAQRLGVLYSLLVKQRALSTTAYDFFQRMKKNSEALGSIFDPQPSESRGNIHNVLDPAEPVIGFVEAASSTERRIFISKEDVPGWNYSSGCQEYRPFDPEEEYPLPNDPEIIKDAVEGKGLLPIEPARMFFGAIVSFSAAPAACIDCTISGTNKRPSFWP